MTAESSLGAAVERECQQVGREGAGGAGGLEEPGLRTEWVEEAEDTWGML